MKPATNSRWITWADSLITAAGWVAIALIIFVAFSLAMIATGVWQ